MQLRGDSVLNCTYNYFVSLLLIAMALTFSFALFDMAHGAQEKAFFEVSMFICFAVAAWFSYQNQHVRIFMYLALLTGLFSMLGIMRHNDITAHWVPVVTVVAFGFLGKKEGAYWALFSLLCVSVVLVLDLLEEDSIFTLRQVVNILLGSSILSLIVYYSYYTIEQKQQLLIQAERKRERLEVSRRFSSNIAHLINNRMQIVVGEAEMALRAQSADEQAKHLRRIFVAADKASEHANQLVAFAQGESVVYQEKVNLKDVLASCIQRWKAELSENTQLIVTSSFSGSGQCLGDAKQLSLVFLGILENAYEAVSDNEGYQSIHVSLVDKRYDEASAPKGLNEGEYVLITITDNGCGIPDNIKDKLFEPFVSTRFLGRGMGLAAALGVIQSHQGHIAATSQGLGSTLYIWLPIFDSSIQKHHENWGAVGF